LGGAEQHRFDFFKHRFNSLLKNCLLWVRFGGGGDAGKSSAAKQLMDGPKNSPDILIPN
jgi:hypothetical protein